MTRHRQRRTGSRTLAASDTRVDQAQVDLAFAALTEQDVAGFQIAVDHTPPMDVGDGIDQRRKELTYLWQRQRAILQAMSKVAALDIGSDKEKTPLYLAKLEQWQNMLMLQVSADFGFAQKALARRNIVNQVFTDNFDRYFTIKSRALPCQVDLAHAANVDATH